MPELSDRQRIEAMREAGSISPEEARMLLEAIGEATPPEPLVGEQATAVVTATTTDDGTEAEPNRAEARRWCTVKLLAGEVEVEVADIPSPVLVEGEGFTLAPDGDGMRLSDSRGVGLGVLGIRLGRRDSRARLQLPRDWGLALDVKAGDVRARDVRWVRGQMLAGDVRLLGTEWVDLVKLAGDIEAHLKPTTGEQRIESRAGDLEVHLLSGSDVRVIAEVTIGELEAPGFEVVERAVGARAERVFGAGTALLKLNLTAGDLAVRAASGGTLP
jgi:hypothetical protein